MLPPVKIPTLKTNAVIYGRYPNTNPTLWKEDKNQQVKIDTATIKSAQLENKMLSLIKEFDGISTQEIARLVDVHKDTVGRILRYYKGVGVVQLKSRRWYLT
jgi:predicted transcriptional regulator